MINHDEFEFSPAYAAALVSTIRNKNKPNTKTPEQNRLMMVVKIINGLTFAYIEAEKGDIDTGRSESFVVTLDDSYGFEDPQFRKEVENYYCRMGWGCYVLEPGSTVSWAKASGSKWQIRFIFPEGD